MLWVEGGSVRRPGRFKTTKTQNTHHAKKLTTKTMQTNPYLNRYLWYNVYLEWGVLVHAPRV